MFDVLNAPEPEFVPQDSVQVQLPIRAEQRDRSRLLRPEPEGGDRHPRDLLRVQHPGSRGPPLHRPVQQRVTVSFTIFVESAYKSACWPVPMKITLLQLKLGCLS